VTKRMCYSFEPSGHRFRPLDGSADGSFVFRLYCPNCSRVVFTAPEHNYVGWNAEELPAESQVDFMTNFSIARKES
jgi:hypothetical protein